MTPSQSPAAPRLPSRRRFLGTAGTLLALPLFESLLPRRARAATPPRRLLFFFVPNGIHMPAWTPAQVGAGYTLPPILAPLAPHKDELLVLSGLSNRPARPEGPGDHAGGTSGFLTCAHAKKSDSDIQLGISVDQVAAQKLAAGTRFASFQLGLEGGVSAGGCDSGYSCAYTRNISWAGPKTPLPKLVDPQLVFDVLFQGQDPGKSVEERERRRRYQTSVLDYALADAQRLQLRLGQTDRHKLDEYMTGVRALEVKLSSMQTACAGASRPVDGQLFPEQVKAMADLMVLAMQCDLTRVQSFMLGNGLSGRSYAFIGVSGAHHELSHHMNDPVRQAALQTIDTWEIAQLAYLLGRMKAVKEGSGTLLDSSLVFFSSEIADGNSHSHIGLPVVVAGKLGGAVRPGRHIDYKDQPMANLFVSILQAIGMPVTRFGDDSTGPLADLG